MEEEAIRKARKSRLRQVKRGCLKLEKRTKRISLKMEEEAIRKARKSRVRQVKRGSLKIEKRTKRGNASLHPDARTSVQLHYAVESRERPAVPFGGLHPVPLDAAEMFPSSARRYPPRRQRPQLSPRVLSCAAQKASKTSPTPLRPRPRPHLRHHT